jgi:hypothetical protein
MMPIPPRDVQKQLVLDYARKQQPMPILSGAVSLMFGWWSTLRGTEELLDEMVHDGTLRQATKEECRRADIRQGYCSV